MLWNALCSERLFANMMVLAGCQGKLWHRTYNKARGVLRGRTYVPRILWESIWMTSTNALLPRRQTYVYSLSCVIHCHGGKRTCTHWVVSFTKFLFSLELTAWVRVSKTITVTDDFIVLNFSSFKKVTPSGSPSVCGLLRRPSEVAVQSPNYLQSELHLK
jgi:hypothetical protein